MRLNTNQAGLSLGALFALMHAFWVVMVAVGMGQAIIQWMLSLHFISADISIGTATIGIGLAGVLVAFVCGYICGWLFAWIWNWIGTKVR